MNWTSTSAFEYSCCICCHKYISGTIEINSLVLTTVKDPHRWISTRVQSGSLLHADHFTAFVHVVPPVLLWYTWGTQYYRATSLQLKVAWCLVCTYSMMVLGPLSGVPPKWRSLRIECLWSTGSNSCLLLWRVQGRQWQVSWTLCQSFSMTLFLPLGVTGVFGMF